MRIRAVQVVVLMLAGLAAVEPALAQNQRPRRNRRNQQQAQTITPESLGGVPEWIWLPMTAENQTASFRREVLISEKPTSVKFVGTADDQMTVFVDGKQVFEHSGWDKVILRDLTALFASPGKHTLAIQAKNSAGPAGLVARLSIETPGAAYVLTTGPSWKVSEKPSDGWLTTGYNDERWVAAVSSGKLGDGPRTEVNPAAFASAAPDREPEATPISQMKVAKGFQAELLYSVPKGEQGSWVNMCVDPKGRLIVSDQNGGLYRVTPAPVGTPANDDSAPRVTIEKIEVDIGEAQGLLWAFDSLYVVVNRGGKYDSGLYRVRDTNGDDKLDSLETLKKINGGGEHGPHAVVLSPDGKSLFIVCGNGTKMVDYTKTRVPPVWGEDHLLPRMPDGKGFMRDVLGPGGCIYQIDPDGKEWELYSTGFRNEFDAAFNRDGDLFTYDADMEWDVNTPWYRPTRVCLATSGAEFGWRNGAGKWPSYYADSLPSVVDVGPGSPTGICFGYGTKFPQKYQDALYICDWSYGKLYATHLKPQGASYTGELEEFVTGTPLPLTDVVVNPMDGALYFAIGGRKVQSGLYRVTHVGPRTDEPATAGNDNAERVARLELEKLHERKDESAIAKIWPHLSAEDRFVRFAARVALEHQDPAWWREKALNEKNAQAALTSLLALARVSASCPQHRAKDAPAPDAATGDTILKTLLSLDYEALTYVQRLELLRTIHIALNRFGMPEAEMAGTLRSRFDAVYPGPGRELNVEIANLLVYLDAPKVAEKTVRLLEAAPTQEEQIDYARALRVLKTGWTPELRKAYFGWFLKAAHYRGGASFSLFVQGIRKDAVATLSEAEQVALKDILEAKPDLPQPVVGPPRPVVKQYKLEELLPAIDTKLSGRNFDKGRQLFGAANCFACHRYDNEGGANGPDLTGIAGRFSKRDLLESIVDPSKVISDQYGAVNIETEDGKVYSGRIVNLSGDTFSLNTNMLNPDEQSKIDRRQIVEMEPSRVSMMPEGLLNTLQEDEILDLFAYLLSRGDRNSPMFK